MTIAEDYKELPSLPHIDMLPNSWAILCLEVRWTFWNVLAYEQDDMEEEARAARQEYAEAAQALRARFDPHPRLGPKAADLWIASEVQAARIDLARALEEEQAWQDVFAGGNQARRRNSLGSHRTGGWIGGSRVATCEGTIGGFQPAFGYGVKSRE